MSIHYGLPLRKRPVRLNCGIEVAFDAVSDDGSVVGDCKNLGRLGSGKRATVSECACLLQDAPNAEHRFIVFGTESEVAKQWLQRFGPMADDVDFFFLDRDGLVILDRPHR